MKKQIDRREFLRSAAAIGVGSVIACGSAMAGTNATKKAQLSKCQQVPRSILGKTGEEISSLSLGAAFDTIESPDILELALKWGVNYWDTAPQYEDGRSEIGIGKFFAKNPDVRKDIFLVTKASGAKSIADVEELLQSSLKVMNTSYIDLYYGVHNCDDPARLTDELKQWAASAKKRGLIRYFGFSTHKNMAKSIMAASKLDWIDAIMTTYNFRLMNDPELKAAVEACHKAGIAIIAMKVQGQKSKKYWRKGEDAKVEKVEKKFSSHFLEQGFTEGQAKVKAVLEDKKIASACLGKGNIEHLKLNIAAVLNKTKLTSADRDVFRNYAQQTCGGYCAGCGYICDAAVPDTPYVSEIMRYLMYYNSYDEKNEAKRLFAQIPAVARNRLLSIDYRGAQARCPQKLPIAELIAEAVEKLA
jgi:aryl-alcohol dehydrogenase-like predicted oxidoreductase